MHVSHVRSLTPSHAETNGCQGGAFAADVVESHAANKIQAAFHSGIALKELLRGVELVDEHESFGGIAADVEADRGALPVHRQARAAAHLQCPFAIAHSDADGAAGFLALDEAIGLA